ncbi:MAG TPA: signal peptidase I [Mycobacteriales bacterium]|nr:signal peptidase I [Mycobacteriales bacterium]
MASDERRPDEPAFVVTRRALRRAVFAAAALLVLAGVGIGAYFLGRSNAPSHVLGRSSNTAASSTAVSPPETKTFKVPSTAMWPTIKGGDTIEVGLSAYAKSSPRAGDIIVFKRPPAENCGGAPVADLVKRVVGLPGQTVSAHTGKVYVTGKLLKEPWLPKDPHTYTTMTGSYTVPKGDYYMMGDNRTDSCDSRMWGPVKRSYIVGKVVKVLAAPTTPASATTTTTTATTTTAPRLAGVPWCGSSEAVVKPASVTIGCGGSQPHSLTGIAWSTWTNLHANGTGTLHVDLCTPDCAAGPEASYAATVTLSHSETRSGQLIFECVTVDAPGSATGRVVASTVTTTCTPASANVTAGGWGAQG